MNWITLQLYKIAIHLRIKASYLIQGVLYKGLPILHYTERVYN